MLSKADIRKEAMRRRAALTGTERLLKSRQIAELVLTSAEWTEADHILLYASMPHEVKTRDLIREALSAGKDCFLPKVIGHTMRFYRLRDPAELHPGAFGIAEPQGSEHFEGAEALMLMPGLAFDKDFRRVGHGGGYYDRFLAENGAFGKGGITKMALSFASCLFPELPAEPYDIRADLIVTEHGIIRKES